MYYVQYVNDCIDANAFNTNITLTEENENLLQHVEHNINDMCVTTIKELIHALGLLLSHKYISVLSSCNENDKHNVTSHKYMVVDFDILNILLNVAENKEQRMYIFNSVFSIIIVKLMLYLNMLTN